MESVLSDEVNSVATEVSQKRHQYNGIRFDQANQGGHYESYFVRANHPSKPLGFWIRYTVFSPKLKPVRGVGELWAIFFDGEQKQVTAAKQEIPLSQCNFSSHKLDARIGDARFEGEDNGGQLAGVTSSGDNEIAWDIRYEGCAAPLLDFPEKLYKMPLPKAKALVGNPNAMFTGTITVNGEGLQIDQWQGSENHNWGSKHTDEYAWGQVAGFDNNKEAFLECATARLKMGPMWLPQMTLVTLRLDGEEYAFNDILDSVKARANYSYFNWRFEVSKPGVKVIGWLRADSDIVVGLNYYNPPGGTHTCLNCKIAECKLEVQRDGQDTVTLYTKNRAAFEILTDDTSHGVAVVV